MGNKYKLNRKCETCGSPLLDNNKTGFCRKHMDRTGVNNPFYGKHHDPNIIEETKKKLSIISKNLWQDDEYREYIIKAVSKPRRAGFKKEQSDRIKRWYRDNPEQREIRRVSMTENWRKGIITKNNYSCNRSKIEKEFFDDLANIYPDIGRETMHYGKSWLLPDITIVNDRIVIEFYGNFWHANPKMYKSGDTIHHSLSAQDIWDRDALRLSKFEELGFWTFVVWEDEYKQDPEMVLRKFDSILNWESCCL
jgi:hypothetical protein